MTTKNPFPGINPFFEQRWQDQCRERGRSHRLRYRAEPNPPFTPEDAAWMDQILRQHQLR